MATDYTAISVAPVAREELRTFAAMATGVLRQRVTMTDALRLALIIATPYLATEGHAAWQQLIEATDPNGAEK